MKKIMSNRMDRGFYQYEKEFENKALEVLHSGWYILGKEVEAFEKEFSSYIGTNGCVGVACGLDALWIAFRLLGIGSGDEVIVPSNTYVASVMGVTINGATPVFVEPDEYYNIDADKIEEKITERTKAVLVVHLYGQAADMGKITKLVHKYNLKLVEDCAQSHGAAWNGQMTGSFGSIGCFSFYPSKNLGAFGDAGAMVMNDQALAEEGKIFRNYGSDRRYYNKVVGANSRLDEMQAGLLRVRLQHINELNKEKEQIARCYLEGITNEKIILPGIRKDCGHVWHQFVVRCSEQERFMKYLDDHGIGTLIHYPIPPHLQKAYSYLGYHEGDFPIAEQYAKEVVSLPIYYGMTEEEIAHVINVINVF